MHALEQRIDASRLLLGMGTQFGQGYLFQRPVPLELGGGEPLAARDANAA